MFDVPHRPVYGSMTKDEFVCSCGWSGPTLEVPEHCAQAAKDARERIVRFVSLVEDRCLSDDWKELQPHEGTADFLSPHQFVVALQQQGFTPLSS